MTLDTRIYVHGDPDPRQVFAKCNELIGGHEGIRFTDNGRSIMNAPGQGLDAWLSVEYPIENAPLEVSFDTGYGYDGPEGGVRELHVRLIRQLGAWLDEHRWPWSWRNEFTGDLYQGTDGLDTLGTWPRDEIARATGS